VPREGFTGQLRKNSVKTREYIRVRVVPNLLEENGGKATIFDKESFF